MRSGIRAIAGTGVNWCVMLHDLVGRRKGNSPVLRVWGSSARPESLHNDTLRAGATLTVRPSRFFGGIDREYFYVATACHVMPMPSPWIATSLRELSCWYAFRSGELPYEPCFAWNTYGDAMWYCPMVL
jgi:hypothetical protein